jgi:ATP-dependent helicase HrpA
MASWADTVRAADAAPSFHEAVASAVRALRDVVVPDDAWDDERLPAHLRMTFRVEEERGGGAVVLDEGKDLIALQRRLAARTQDAVRVAVRSAVRDAMREAARESGASTTAPTAAGAEAGSGGVARGQADAATTGPTGGGPAGATPASATPVAERTGLTTWPADLPGGRLPEVVETVAPGGVVVRGYPALVEEPGPRHEPTVALRVLADARQQAAAHRRGVRRLVLLETALATSRVTTRWSGTQALTLAASPYRTTEALVADVQLAAVDALVGDRGEVRDSGAYRMLRDAVRPRLEDTVHRVVTDLVAVLTAARELDAAVRSSTSLALLSTLQDVREQAAALVHDGFVAETGAARLPHLTRYLRAAQHRLAKAADNPNRDAQLAWTVHDLEALLDAARARVESGSVDPARTAALTDVRWMLEELRVSLFAQQLGTPTPVSEKRVRAALAAI